MHHMGLRLGYYKIWFPKLVNAFYDNMYSFSKHIAIICGIFLHLDLVSIICTNNTMC